MRYYQSLAPQQNSPANFVSQLVVELEPARASVDCSAFPYTLEVRYTLVVTGPVTAKVRRVRSDGVEKSGTYVEFENATPQTFSDTFEVNAAGTYWYRVQVTSPNTKQAEASAEVVCK